MRVVRGTRWLEAARGALLAFVALSCVSTAAAQHPELPRIQAVAIGLGNFFRAGRWLPVEVTLRGGTQNAIGQLTVDAPDASGTLMECTTFEARPVQVLAGATVTATVYARFGSLPDLLTVRFTRDDGAESREAFETWNIIRNDGNQYNQQDAAYWLKLGGQFNLPEGDKKDQIEQFNLTADALPRQWFGYNAIDTVIVSGSQPELLSPLASNAALRGALDQWVREGGRIIVFAGSNGEQLFAPDGPLAPFAPGKIVGVETLARGDALESYVGAKERLAPPGAGKDLALPFTRLAHPRGLIVIRDDDAPLLVRASHGLGEVVFAAFAVDRAPLANWASRDALVAAILGGRRPEEVGVAATGGSANMPDGSLTAHLRGGLEQFQGVRLVPFWFVALAILGYILLIGPIDYFVVRRVFRRTELTWITFPTIVLFIVIASYGIAYATKGSALRINQVDLVDVGTDGQVRGRAWSDMFSPRTATYDLTQLPADGYPAGFERPETLFSWLALQGNMRGEHGGGVSLFSTTYRPTPALDGVVGVPIDIWSSRAFESRWSTRTLAPRSRLEVGPDGTLRGDFELPEGLPALDDALLAFNRWAYVVGRIESGQTVDVEKLPRRDLAGSLKDARAVKTRSQDSFTYAPTPFNPELFDVVRSVRVMAFYDAINGGDYTRMTNDDERMIDMSRQLELGEAVLFGQADAARPPTTLADSGEPLGTPEDRHWVFYRVVFDVKNEN